MIMDGLGLFCMCYCNSIVSMYGVNEILAPPGIELGMKKLGASIPHSQPEHPGGLPFPGSLDGRQPHQSHLEQYAQCKFCSRQSSCLLSYFQPQDDLAGNVELQLCITEKRLAPSLQITSSSCQLGLEP